MSYKVDNIREAMLMNRYEALFGKGITQAKAEAFDIIASNFYFGNFGTMSKSDLETLMFSLFLERVQKIDSPAIQTESDFALAGTLGITENRISALKIRKELRYPTRDLWKKHFKIALQKVEQSNGKFKIAIPDPTTRREVLGRLEMAGEIVDMYQNPKNLLISPEGILLLLYDCAPEEERKPLLEKMQKVQEETGSRIFQNSVQDVDEAKNSLFLNESSLTINGDVHFNIGTPEENSFVGKYFKLFGALDALKDVVAPIMGLLGI